MRSHSPRAIGPSSAGQSGMATWRTARQTFKGLTERQVRDHLHHFNDIWTELFPAEQARIVQLLVSRVEVSTTGADITLRTDGLGALMQDLRGNAEQQDRAA